MLAAPLLLLQLLCGHIMDGVLLLGSSCGRCHMLNLDTGKSVSAAAASHAAAASNSNSSSSSGDHDGPVTCISGNSYLQHFVTCSRDGYVKVSCRHAAWAIFIIFPSAASSIAIYQKQRPCPHTCNAIPCCRLW
jgi:hypothetical protein